MLALLRNRLDLEEHANHRGSSFGNRAAGIGSFVLEDSLESRVQRTLRDYVIDLCSELIALHGSEQGFRLFSQRMLESLANILKRLCGERYQRLLGLLHHALKAQQVCADTHLHTHWIEVLLEEYYDPMYAFQRTEIADRIGFSGDQTEVLDNLQQRKTSVGN